MNRPGLETDKAVGTNAKGESQKNSRGRDGEGYR